MTQLLILGAQGQVGRALVMRARQASIRCDALGRLECDIGDRAAVERVVKPGRVVVNCAAYTAVDRAETEAEAAYRVNSVGAGNVAAACAAAGVPLVHLSTDYIFDGESQKPAREDDPPRPLNVYGHSKLAGEIAVRQRLNAHIILRSSWIFSAHGQNFVKTILRLAKTQSPLRVVDDQIGGPTAADDIAKAILGILAIAAKPDFAQWGTYHLSGAPPVSWCEFARVIVSQSGSATVVLPIATRDYPSPVCRPLNSALDCSRIRQVFGIEQPDWRAALGNVLEALSAAGSMALTVTERLTHGHSLGAVLGQRAQAARVANSSRSVASIIGSYIAWEMREPGGRKLASIPSRRPPNSGNARVWTNPSRTVRKDRSVQMREKRLGERRNQRTWRTRHPYRHWNAYRSIGARRSISYPDRHRFC
jgi:dTDP-4-dehydrorhamnose reductase